MMQGHELKALRKAARMTQGQLAEAVGLSLGHVGDMERGDVPIEKRNEMAVRYITSLPLIEAGMIAADVAEGAPAAYWESPAGVRVKMERL